MKMSPRVAIFVLILAGMCGAVEEDVSLPPRPRDALSGSAFAAKISSLNLARRDREILAQVLSGNVPPFWRSFAEVEVEDASQGVPHRASYWVAPDYLAVGSDEDYFLAPVAPSTAQAVADALECVLPTCRMVDQVYRS